jgi:hypothetical protein
MDNIHVDESPAIYLETRGRGEEWHGGSGREETRHRPKRQCSIAAELRAKNGAYLTRFFKDLNSFV